MDSSVVPNSVVKLHPVVASNAGTLGSASSEPMGGRSGNIADIRIVIAADPEELAENSKVQLAAHNEQGGLVSRGTGHGADSRSRRLGNFACFSPGEARAAGHLRGDFGYRRYFSGVLLSLNDRGHVKLVRTTHLSQGRPQLMRDAVRCDLVLVFSYCFGLSFGPKSTIFERNGTQGHPKSGSAVSTSGQEDEPRRDGEGRCRGGTDGSVKKVEPVGEPDSGAGCRNCHYPVEIRPGTESQETVELHFTP